MGVNDYSTTPSLNTQTGDGTSVAEGMNAASVNNAIRSVMADIAEYRDEIGPDIKSKAPLYLKGGKTFKSFGYSAVVADDGKWINLDPNDPISPIAARLPAVSTITSGWSIVFDFEGNPLTSGKRLWSDADIVLDGVVQDWNGSQGMTVYSGMVIQFTFTGSVWFAEMLASYKGESGHVTNVAEVVIDLRPYLDGDIGVFELDITRFQPVTAEGQLNAQFSTDGGLSWLTSYEGWGLYSVNETPYATKNPGTFQFAWVIAPVSASGYGSARVTAQRSSDFFVWAAHSNAVDTAGTGYLYNLSSRVTGAAVNAVRLYASSGNISDMIYSFRKIARP